jgi:hypothetical protein
VTRWQPSSIRQLPLYCNRRHGFRRRRDSKCRPFLGLHPGFAVPPAFLPIGIRVLTCALDLASRGCAGADGWGALVLSIARRARLSSLSQSNSDFTRLRALPPNTLTSSYYFRHSNKHAQRKPNSLGHKFSGTAFGWSSFLTFVSRRSLALRSAPSVNPACAALRGAYTKTAPCSLPRP